MQAPSARILVLMYHRIDEPDTDPWNICVEPKHFEEQISFIKNHMPVISAEEVVYQVTTNSICENSVCVTFDDGYADNYLNALPILQNQQCPATFFIATSFIGHSIPYWWDELEIICLHTIHLPSVLQITIPKKTYSFYFETELTEQIWLHHKHWKWHEETPTKRCNAFLSLWNLLRPLPLATISKKMEEIRNWANTEFHSRLPMNESQLRELSQHKIATIGLHTHTHIDLREQPANVQAHDILTGKLMLAEQFGIQANLLAYPYGRYNNSTLSTVEKLRVDGCFTTESIPVTSDSCPSALGRYGVQNWTQQQFEQQLENWIHR